MKTEDQTMVAFLVLFLLCVLGAIGITVFSAYQESRTYNKLTGAHTTWWDALWVELRVQNETEK